MAISGGIVLSLLLAATAAAQVIVDVSRDVDLTPMTALYTATVNAPDFESALATLAPFGVTAADFRYANTDPASFTFNISAPYTTRLSPMDRVHFDLAGFRGAVPAAPPDLIADARKRAQQIGSALGLPVGGIRSMTDLGPFVNGLRASYRLTVAFDIAGQPAAADDGISVTVAGPVSSAPDFANYAVSVNLPVSATLDDAVARVSALRLTAADFTYWLSSDGLGTFYFYMTVPYDQQAQAVARLKDAGLDYRFDGYTPKPADLAATAGPLSLNARLRAQSIASTAGKTLGRIVEVRDSVAVTMADRWFNTSAFLFGVPAFGQLASPQPALIFRFATY